MCPLTCINTNEAHVSVSTSLQ